MQKGRKGEDIRARRLWGLPGRSGLTRSFLALIPMTSEPFPPDGSLSSSLAAWLYFSHTSRVMKGGSMTTQSNV